MALKCITYTQPSYQGNNNTIRRVGGREVYSEAYERELGWNKL